MGASSWEYFVPFVPDVKTAFRQLQREVYRTGQFRHPVGFAMTKKVDLVKLREFAGLDGTHSILDVATLVTRRRKKSNLDLLVEAYGSFDEFQDQDLYLHEPDLFLGIVGTSTNQNAT